MNSTSTQAAAANARSFATGLDSLLRDCWTSEPSKRLLCGLASTMGVVSGVPLLGFLLVGCLGNAMATHLLLVRKKDKTRQSVYLGAISAATVAIAIVYGLLHFFLASGLPWLTGGSAGWLVGNASDLACRASHFLQCWLSLLCYGLFLAMACDRALSMHWPLRYQTRGHRAAVRVCAGVAMATVAMTSHVPVLAGWRTLPSGLIYCAKGATTGGLGVFNFIFHGFAMGFPPSLLILGIVVANAALVHRVVRISRRRCRMLAVRQVGAAAARKLDGSIRSCIVCVATSVALLLGSLPCMLAVMLTDSLDFMPGADPVLTKAAAHVCHICKVVLLCELSINWLVLAWKSPEFRRSLLDCFGGRLGSDSGSSGSGTKLTGLTGSR